MPELLFPDQVGVRQSLSDMITMTDAKSKPVLAMAKKGQAPIQALYSWQADSYKDPQFDGVLSNKDVDSFDNPAAERVLLEGRVQKFWRLSKVDDFAENVNTVAGVPSEMARALKKDLEHIGRDVESALCSDRDSQKQSGTNPNRCRGLGSWIQSTAQTDLPVPASQRTPAASIVTTAIASFTSNVIQDFIQSMYLQSGKPINHVLVAGPTLKRAFTAFAQTQFGSTNSTAAVRTYLEYAGDKRITQAVDVFEGDCGTLEILLSLFLARDQASDVQLRRGYAFDQDAIELAYNRRPQSRKLEDLGGGPRALTDCIGGWKIGSPLGMGKIAPSA